MLVLAAHGTSRQAPKRADSAINGSLRAATRALGSRDLKPCEVGSKWIVSNGIPPSRNSVPLLGGNTLSKKAVCV